MVNSITCIFHFFEAPNDPFEAQFLQGFMFTPNHMNWEHAAQIFKSGNIV